MRKRYRVKTGLAAALVAVGVLCALPGAWANNLRVTNTTVVAGASSAGTTIVQFDIAWEWGLLSGRVSARDFTTTTYTDRYYTYGWRGVRSAP